MSLDKIILLLVDFSGGEITGKTLLQKQLYFLSILLNKDFGFSAHYYGPYSSRVEEELTKLKVLGFLNEQSLNYGFFNQSGFEVKGYKYFLSSKGKVIVDGYKEENQSFVKKIRRHLIELKKQEIFDDYFLLSIAAKTYYIVAKEGKAVVKDIGKLAKNYGWVNIDDLSISKAIEFLSNTKLVKV